MAINTWKLWEWLGWKKRVERIDVAVDINAIMTYLNDVQYDVDGLLKLFKKLQKLRKEAKLISDDNILLDNLRKQIELYDQLLLRYEYYDTDAQVNGIRVKQIAKQYMKEAKKNKFYGLLDKMKRESRWFFD